MIFYSSLCPLFCSMFFLLIAVFSAGNILKSRHHVWSPLWSEEAGQPGAAVPRPPGPHSDTPAPQNQHQPGGRRPGPRQRAAGLSAAPHLGLYLVTPDLPALSPAGLVWFLTRLRASVSRAGDLPLEVRHEVPQRLAVSGGQQLQCLVKGFQLLVRIQNF